MEISGNKKILPAITKPISKISENGIEILNNLAETPEMIGQQNKIDKICPIIIRLLRLNILLLYFTSNCIVH
jgi:hypothetical protein